MKDREIIIQREQLYNEVWSETLTKLSQRYGITNLQLKKICDTLHVPSPLAGYWVQKSYGKDITPIPLPPIDNNTPCSYTFYFKEGIFIENQEMFDMADILKYESDPKNRIIVPKKLNYPHPIIQELINYLDNRKIDIKHPSYLALISVSKESTKRALRILDTLIKELEKRQYLKINTRFNNEVMIEIFGISYEFRVKEKNKRIDNPLLQTVSVDRQWLYQKYNLMPTGILELQLIGYGLYDFKKSWSDGKVLVEERLNEFIIDYAKSAILKKKEEDERKIRQKIREEEIKKEEETQKKKIKEIENIELLKNQALLFSQSKQIKLFIDNIKDKLLINEMTANECMAINKWITWASNVADKINPLTSFDLKDYDIK